LASARIASPHRWASAAVSAGQQSQQPQCFHRDHRRIPYQPITYHFPSPIPHPPPAIHRLPLPSPTIPIIHRLPPSIAYHCHR
jgi:hypothetical protein